MNVGVIHKNGSKSHALQVPRSASENIWQVIYTSRLCTLGTEKNFSKDGKGIVAALGQQNSRPIQHSTLLSSESHGVQVEPMINERLNSMAVSVLSQTAQKLRLRKP